MAKIVTGNLTTGPLIPEVKMQGNRLSICFFNFEVLLAIKVRGFEKATL